MRIKCGWAELVDPVHQEVVARGSVSAYAIPSIGTGPWEGEVRLLRGHEQLIDLERATWLLRFEHGFAQRWVELQSVDLQWAPSGQRAVAWIRCDQGVPPVVNELGGE